jgi:hypothetical protein
MGASSQCQQNRDQEEEADAIHAGNSKGNMELRKTGTEREFIKSSLG